MSFPEYYRRANPHLFALLPKRADQILEIGCGAGALSAAYKREVSAETIYTGVEITESAAREAAEVLDRVIHGNIETMDNAELGIEAGQLDCLVYGDVLEHLNDPWAELEKRRPLLKERGTVLACIPNVGHWSVITRLLMGEWTYEDSGIMDRTHLRFFTRASIREMFEGAGYAITRLQGIPKEAPFTERFFAALTPALTELGLDTEVFRTEAVNLQYVVRARVKR